MMEDDIFPKKYRIRPIKYCFQIGRRWCRKAISRRRLPTTPSGPPRWVSFSTSGFWGHFLFFLPLLPVFNILFTSFGRFFNSHFTLLYLLFSSTFHTSFFSLFFHISHFFLSSLIFFSDVSQRHHSRKGYFVSSNAGLLERDFQNS